MERDLELSWWISNAVVRHPFPQGRTHSAQRETASKELWKDGNRDISEDDVGKKMEGGGRSGGRSAAVRDVHVSASLLSSHAHRRAVHNVIIQSSSECHLSGEEHGREISGCPLRSMWRRTGTRTFAGTRYGVQYMVPRHQPHRVDYLFT